MTITIIIFISLVSFMASCQADHDNLHPAAAPRLHLLTASRTPFRARLQSEILCRADPALPFIFSNAPDPSPQPSASCRASPIPALLLHTSDYPSILALYLDRPHAVDTSWSMSTLLPPTLHHFSAIAAPFPEHRPLSLDWRATTPPRPPLATLVGRAPLFSPTGLLFSPHIQPRQGSSAQPRPDSASPPQATITSLHLHL